MVPSFSIASQAALHLDVVLEPRLHQPQGALDLLVQIGVLQLRLVHA